MSLPQVSILQSNQQSYPAVVNQRSSILSAQYTCLRGLCEPPGWVNQNQMRQAVPELLRTWWAAMLQDPARLYSHQYQAYAILSMCRALYTLQHGALISKPASASWALDTMGSKWSPIISEAMQWRRGQSMNRLKDTLDFIRFAIHQSQQFEIVREWE
jgi:hypothetical protein